MKSPDMFKKSILVVSHPDDEILWFSSIFDKVEEVVFCFLDAKYNPEWTIGRKQSLSEHPLKNISCLGIDESEVFSTANWLDPAITTFGLRISDIRISDRVYKQNYYKLKKDLKNKLKGFCNVFSHNPWGEYGNEEHVQIYRVIKELQEHMKFNLWFSNYCGNKSFKLMLKYISGFNSEYVTLKTNITMSNNIKRLYKKNGCWTWYDDWKWFSEESFMKDGNIVKSSKKYGHIFPVNMIKEELPSNRFHKAIRALSGIRVKKKTFF